MEWIFENRELTAKQKSLLLLFWCAWFEGQGDLSIITRNGLLKYSGWRTEKTLRKHLDSLLGVWVIETGPYQFRPSARFKKCVEKGK